MQLLVETKQRFDCDLLYSAGRYLDFLPKGVNKGTTLTALIRHLSIPAERILVAGDTLNDLAMFQQSFLGVCVGESEEGLLEKTKRLPKTYHAKKSGCGGILEAISYFNFLGEKAIAEATVNQSDTGESDLVIVYHRLPYEETIEGGRIYNRPPKSPNGIIPTLLSFFADGYKGSWVAWSTLVNPKDSHSLRTHLDPEKYSELTVSKVPLSKKQVDIFYKRFSKEAFWPTLHTFWEQAKFNEDHWEVFMDVNRLFAERAAEEAAKNAVVWIHDYNLWMVPAFLRELRPDVTIAFFHHTYFPSADVFNVLPWRRDIVGSLLQCDFIGFHIPRQSENFIDVARGVMPLNVLEKTSCSPRFLSYGCAVGLEEMTTCIEIDDRKVHLGALPVGLDLNRIKNVLDSEKHSVLKRKLNEQLYNTKIMLSVERLDYTKGILPKLNAYEKLLEQHPEWIGEVSLISICVPAAKEMTVYKKLQTQIEQTVGRINGRFAKVGWTPVQFFFRSFPFEELVSYYALADIMWITPLRDGLNLVAKEFVATQAMTQGKGLLVLSEFTGAAAELRGGILTNPHDLNDLVNKCYQALTTSDEEAHARLKEAYEVVQYNDISQWGEDFMAIIRKIQGDSLKLKIVA